LIAGLLLLSVVPIMAGCTSKAVLLTNAPDCTSSVEGFLHSPAVWMGNPSVLIRKRMNTLEVVDGVIVEQQYDGIVFDQDRVSPFFDPGPELYPYEDLVAAVDEHRKVIHGELPKEYTRIWALELHVRPVDQPKARTLRMSFKPNERFGYCVPPGVYEVKRILFVTRDGDKDEGVQFPELRLSVQENHSNYIGDLYLNAAGSDTSRAISIPYKVLARPNQGAALGAMFGPAGGVLHAVAKATAGTATHALYVENRSPFKFYWTPDDPDGVVNLLAIRARK
jgi:hypothetical protein